MSQVFKEDKAMEEIMEYFGNGLLQVVGAALFLGIFAACIGGNADGMLSDIVQIFMAGLCG